MENAKFTGFLGRGWKFPPEFSRRDCGPLMSEAEQDIQESIIILLSTRMNERIMQSRYGCDLNGEVFEAMNVTFLTMLKDHLAFSIRNYEPRVELIDIIMDTSGVYEGRVKIDVQYFIRNINDRKNVVYPFYFKEGTNVSPASFPADQ